MAEPKPPDDQPAGGSEQVRAEAAARRAVDVGPPGPTVTEVTVNDPGPGKPGSVLVPPEQQKETFRQVLAVLLIGLLFVEVLFAVTATWLPAVFGAPNVGLDAFREVMTVVFGPTVALVGSATGFYFGERSAQQRSAPQPRPPGNPRR